MRYEDVRGGALTCAVGSRPAADAGGERSTVRRAVDACGERSTRAGYG
ncbi:hypothetical protein [Streptomyces sp. SP2-10]|nr:hypothetical protein [Streptomyces sp. SP2-10]MBY8843063.1 hypothetical protein [Streptomyces sp. SP2-10]